MHALVTDKATRTAIVCITAAYLGWVWSLRPEDRLKAGPGVAFEGLEKLAESTAIAISGWLFAMLVMLAAGCFIWFQHQRIKAQGDENMRLRQIVDPQRLSASLKKELDNYMESSIKRPID